MFLSFILIPITEMICMVWKFSFSIGTAHSRKIYFCRKSIWTEIQSSYNLFLLSSTFILNRIVSARASSKSAKIERNSV